MATKEFDPAEIVVALENATVEIMRKDALAVLTAVTFGTPVGNPDLWQNPSSAPPGYVGGHARRNWLVSEAAPRTDELEGVDASGGLTISEGRGVIDGYDDLGAVLIVQNNVPYINRLNTGHSTQAPAGFVEKATQAALVDRGREDLD